LCGINKNSIESGGRLSQCYLGGPTVEDKRRIAQQNNKNDNKLSSGSQLIGKLFKSDKKLVCWSAAAVAAAIKVSSHK